MSQSFLQDSCIQITATSNFYQEKNYLKLGVVLSDTCNIIKIWNLHYCMTRSDGEGARYDQILVIGSGRLFVIST